MIPAQNGDPSKVVYAKRTGTHGKRSRFNGFRHSFLEDEFTRQLQLAGVVDSRGNRAKAGAAVHTGIWNAPNGMVEGVECVQPYLDLHSLHQRELPKDRKVKILERIGTQRVPR